eukprot:jgi/Botrbrau1/5978/Bobra.104_1s0009.1
MPDAVDPYLRGLRPGLESAACASGDVHIDDEAVQALAGSLSVQDIKSAVQPLRLPVNFADLQSEVNLLALLHLLDFGSGYDDLLQSNIQRDAHETMQFGVLGMAISGKRLDAVFLKCFSNFAVSNFFSFSSHEDQPSPIPGVQISRPGPLAGLATQLREVMNETGRILEEGGQADLASLVLEILSGQKTSQGRCTAGHLVDELADSLPAFRDQSRVGDTKVVFNRKAQLLAADLCLLFGGEDEHFAFPDYQDLTADAGAVLPAVLQHLGVLKVTGALGDAIAKQDDLPTGAQESSLRAAAVVATDRIVEAAGSTFTAYQLGQYLIAKHGENPAVKALRVVCRSTIAY